MLGKRFTSTAAAYFAACLVTCILGTARLALLRKLWDAGVVLLSCKTEATFEAFFASGARLQHSSRPFEGSIELGIEAHAVTCAPNICMWRCKLHAWPPWFDSRQPHLVSRIGPVTCCKCILSACVCSPWRRTYFKFSQVGMNMLFAQLAQKTLQAFRTASATESKWEP